MKYLWKVVGRSEETLKVPALRNAIENRQLKWFGHLCGMNEDRDQWKPGPLGVALECYGWTTSPGLVKLRGKAEFHESVSSRLGCLGIVLYRGTMEEDEEEVNELI